MSGSFAFLPGNVLLLKGATQLMLPSVTTAGNKKITPCKQGVISKYKVYFIYLYRLLDCLKAVRLQGLLLRYFFYTELPSCPAFALIVGHLVYR